MNSLTIAHTIIHQDEHGRYSLNDLHKASGELPKNKPSEWVRNKQTQALIDELILEQGKAGIPALPIESIRGGEYEFRGTFVVKELVYAYAMWISPAFTLKVIRAYDALTRGELNACGSKRVQFERWWFERYPNDRTIRMMAYQGEPFWYIGQVIRRAAGTIGRRVSTMTAAGVMEPDRLRVARIGAHVWWAHRRKHRNQLGLF